MANVRTSDEGAVRTILLHRPERLNAFDNGLVTDLADALDAAAADPGISVVVLSGSGRAFSTGADLKALRAYLTRPGAGAEAGPGAGGETRPGAGDDGGPGAGRDPAGRRDPGAGVSMFARLLDTLADFPKPLLAAVNGVAVGFGMTILAFADLVLVASDARLRCPFTELGAPPEAGSSYLFPQVVGRQNAAWVLLSSEWITAAEAHAMGLAWKVCDPGELLDVTRAHAAVLATRPVPALMVVKRLLNAPPRDAIAAAVARENAALVEMLRGGLPAGALDGFLERAREQTAAGPGREPPG